MESQNQEQTINKDMNREIKFRAWSNDKRIMLNDYASNSLQSGGIIVTQYHNNSEVAYSKELTLIQFTGLKDSKGIEIYEGDILIDVEIDEEGNDISGRLPVVFCGKTGQWCVDNSYAKDGSHLVNIIEHLGIENLEVVGNIFEHPDLLADNK